MHARVLNSIYLWHWRGYEGREQKATSEPQMPAGDHGRDPPNGLHGCGPSLHSVSRFSRLAHQSRMLEKVTATRFVLQQPTLIPLRSLEPPLIDVLHAEHRQGKSLATMAVG